jgi:hypothetical protein
MLRTLRHLAGRCAPESLHILLHHYRAAGAHPNVVFPRTFTDFVVRRKVRRPTDLMILTTDKLAVRDHVARKMGPEHLIPLLMHSTEGFPGSAAALHREGHARLGLEHRRQDGAFG